MKKVLLFEPIDEAGIELLRSETEVCLCPDLTDETIKEQVANAEALIVRSFQVKREVIEAAGKLEVIGRHGAGVDNIDLELATEKGIAVVNTPTANSQSVAEFVVTSMLVLAKKAVQMDSAMRGGRLSAKNTSLPRLAERMGFKGRELWQKKAGIVGMGKIGRKIASICHYAFDMSILAYDPYLPQGALDLDFVNLVGDLDQLLIESDYVVLQVPLTAQSLNLIGERELQLMKSEAYLVNAARGGVVNETALVNALSEGKLAGAAVDVFTEEPPEKDHPLFKLPNTFVSPHIASITSESLKRMSIELAKGVIEALNGRKPLNMVNPQAFEKRSGQ